MNNEKAVKHYDEGLALYRKGKLSAAERSLRKAIKLNPDYADAYNDLGNVYLKTGQLRESFNAYRKAARYAPEHPMLLNNIGNVLVLQSKFDKAQEWINKAVELDPDNAGGHCNLGNCLRGLGKTDEAIAAYRRAIELNPGHPVFFHNLGEALVTTGEHDQAIDCYNRALELNPEDVKAYQGLGKAWNGLGDLDQSVSCYQKAISIDSACADCFRGLGIAYGDHGQVDNAISALHRALELNPGMVSAYPVLARSKFFSEFDSDVKAMETLLSRKELGESQKSRLGFSLAKAYEDLGEYDRSMETLISAARLKRRQFDYKVAETRALFERIKLVFSAEFLSKLPQVDNPDRTPIFIVGMPRSGTSLVEQILASHPAVFGAGELDDLPQLLAATGKPGEDGQTIEFPESVAGLEGDQLADLGSEYIARLRRYSADATFITDKLPHNFMRIGLIRSILPGARIIHCTREPMDLCLSLFKTDFDSGHPYSYDMAELAQYYRLYRELMDYWQAELPGFVYDLGYEAMVNDQEAQTRQLLEYCELDWDDACLDFHETRRKVRTASNAQVVRPMYQSSVNLWRRYEKQLEPLVAALEA